MTDLLNVYVTGPLCIDRHNIDTIKVETGREGWYGDVAVFRMKAVVSESYEADHLILCDIADAHAMRGITVGGGGAGG